MNVPWILSAPHIVACVLYFFLAVKIPFIDTKRFTTSYSSGLHIDTKDYRDEW